MRRRVLLAVALLSLSFGPAYAWVQVKTDTGIPVYWPDGKTSLQISKKLPPSWSEDTVGPLIQAAVAPWLEVPCFAFDLDYEGFAGPGLGDSKDRVNWLLWTQKDWPFSSSQLAVTLLEFVQKTGEIVDADIYVNIEQKSFEVDATCDPNSVALDLQGILTHEFGHFLGLDHTQVPMATMIASTEPGDCTKRTLHEDDIDGFCATYTNLPEEPDVIEVPPADDVTDASSPESSTAEREPGDEEGCGIGTNADAHWLLFMTLLIVSLRHRRTVIFTGS